MQKYFKCFGKGQIFLSLFHVSGNFKRKIFEKKFGMTKIDRHFLLPNVVICFTLYTREIARNHLLYFLACKCVIYFRMTYLVYVKFDFDSINCFVVLVAPSPIHVANIHLYENELNIKSGG